MRKSNASRRLCGRYRGAATVEALVALPFFVFIFASVLYMEKVYSTQQRANTVARSCTWRYSNTGCQHVPDGCTAGVRFRDVAGPDLDSSALRETLNRAMLESRKEWIAGAVRSALSTVLHDMFVKNVEATKVDSLTRPATFGGGEAALLGSYRLPCNLVPKKPTDIAVDAWKNVF